MQMKLQTY